MPGAEAPTRFEGATPILRVRSLQDSLDYYVRVLGFEVEWQQPGIIASVSRDHCHIMLCEGDQGHPGTWVWIGVEDAEALFEEVRGRGATVRHPPTNYQWAYELQIEDPDGHVLRFGCEPRADLPFGEWHDMHGHTWAMSPGGGWSRVDRPEP
jgi:uncharacterized glyoxalase superfamily protein PhnB